MNVGPNLTICMIVFVVLLIVLPVAYLKEKNNKKGQAKETDAKVETAETQLDPEFYLKGVSCEIPKDESYLGDMPQNKFYRHMANLERERMARAAKEAAKSKKNKR